MATRPDIGQAAKILTSGGVVAFPTETVYGLGADAFNEKAVARIFEIKNRPRFDPLIVHIADMAQLPQVARIVPAAAKKLVARFWPGPLTLVLPRARTVPDIVTAGGDTVGVRMPDHPVALKLIAACGRPVAAPSANPFGSASPTTAAHVRQMLGRKVDAIIDGGPCRVGLESTVIEFPHRAKPRILRLGGLAVEDIEAVVGKVAVRRASSSRPRAPGMLERHYAPRTRLVLYDGTSRAGRTGLLAVCGPTPVGDFAAIEVLSRTGDLREAAARLFAAMRRLDACKLDRIVAVPGPEKGLGRAINDRLRRAAVSPQS